jgi:hypothetical protein
MLDISMLQVSAWIIGFQIVISKQNLLMTSILPILLSSERCKHCQKWVSGGGDMYEELARE